MPIKILVPRQDITSRLIAINDNRTWRADTSPKDGF